MLPYIYPSRNVLPFPPIGLAALCGFIFRVCPRWSTSCVCLVQLGISERTVCCQFPIEQIDLALFAVQLLVFGCQLLHLLQPPA